MLNAFIKLVKTLPLDFTFCSFKVVSFKGSCIDSCKTGSCVGTEVGSLITSTWDITWQAINWTDANFTSVTATTWTITNLTTTDLTAGGLTTDSISTWSMTATGNVLIQGTLWVAQPATLNDVTAWDITASWVSATTWNITTLAATSASVETLNATGNIETQSDLTVAWATSTNWLTNTWDIANSWNFANGWNVSVAGTTTLAWVTTTTLDATGASTLKNTTIDWNASITGTLWVNGATTLNSTLTVAGAATLSDNVSVGWNLTVAGNTTVTWNQTVTGDVIINNNISTAGDLTVSGDATVTDDLIVNGSSHLKTLETTGSASIGWNLSVDWSIAGWSSLVVETQIESASLVTGNAVANTLHIWSGLYLDPSATATDFVLQSEKWQPNGVAPLNVNWTIDWQYLPPIYTSAIVKIGTGTFDNSYSSTVVDDAIKADSFVAISNYQDIVWDTQETINLWSITVVSNYQETGSYKYIVVNPLPSC